MITRCPRREKNENGPDHVKKEEEEGKGRIHKRLRQVKCLTHTSTRIRISVFEVVLDCKKTFLEMQKIWTKTSKSAGTSLEISDAGRDSTEISDAGRDSTLSDRDSCLFKELM